MIKKIVSVLLLLLLCTPAYSWEWGSGFDQGDLKLKKNTLWNDEVDSTPATPPTNQIRLYACDDSGTTKYCTVDSLGAVTILGSGGASISDAVYDATWNGDTTTAASKNAIYDKIETISGTGETNTASNTGSLGTGLFKQKTLADLEFYKIYSENNLLTAALSGTDYFGLTVNESNIDHDALTNFLSAEHVDWAGAAAGTIHTDNYIEGHSNGANCNVGEYPLGVDASGAVESCTDATTEIDSAIATHFAIDAAADGATKGHATFTARDFSDASGVISSRKGDFYNGTFAESFDALVTSNGTTVTLTVTNSSGGDLTSQFSSGNSTFTGGSTIALTAGSDASPQGNWIYILQSAPTTLVKSTSAWPSSEHIKIGYFFVQSASSVQTDGGALVNQNWNDHLQGTDSQGHLSHMARKIRYLGSSYFSGVDANGATASYYTISASNTEFISTSGVVDQMHPQAYSAKDTSAGDVVHVVNSSVSAYRRITDLFSITTDSTGATISNNKFFNLVIWGSANKTGEHQTLLVNVPNGFYNTQSAAENDVSGYDVFNIPRQFGIDSSNGFLIARSTFQMGATWTHISTVDLRGRTPTSATGGVGGVATDFADNAFTVFDNTDNTKVMDFDVGSNVTTGTTRTLKAPDASGNIALTSQTDGTLADADMPDNATVTGWTMGTFSATQLTSPTVLVDLLDGVGAVDMDYGSADITDHTFVTDGGTVIIDGTITPGGNIIMGDNSVTGVDTITFTDTAGTIAGIQNQNLVDKSAAEAISGTWEIQDDVELKFGNDADYGIQYDESVDNQMLFTTTATAAVATTDPMYEFLVGTTPTADQQVFGIAKGTQSTNTALLTVDEDGDVVAAGSVTSGGTVAGILLGGETGDPCATLGEGAIFYNTTSNYMCYCDGTNDLKMNDNSTACF